MKEKFRLNETCVIGLPRCDYVFNSNRSCFIAYGFKESKLEMEILKGILKEKNIEVFEAGTDIEPAKNAFCAKICSKIITSQFCAILLNQDTVKGKKIPNANVNMEYGLMLGFNKYIIPFQRQGDILPFNVSGLDTIKYDQSNFKDKAEKVMEKAIVQTRPQGQEEITVGKILNSILLAKDVLLCSIDDDGNKNLYELGKPFGYNLANDFTGNRYYYVGVFTALTTEQTKWRINKLEQVLTARFSKESLLSRQNIGLITNEDYVRLQWMFGMLSAWILVQSANEKSVLIEYIKDKKIPFEIFCIEDIEKLLETEGLL